MKKYYKLSNNYYFKYKIYFFKFDIDHKVALRGNIDSIVRAVLFVVKIIFSVKYYIYH